MSYIDQHKHQHGVEPICTTLSKAGVPITPSTYYAFYKRAPSARAVRDEQLTPVIVRVHRENYGVFGIRKMHAALAREPALADGRPVARCTTGRLMKQLGLGGSPARRVPARLSRVVARTPARTWSSGSSPPTRPTSCGSRTSPTTGTFAGWVYAAFILDVLRRRVVGWQLSTSLRTDLALDALNMGLWTRQREGHDTSALVHHSDKGRAVRRCSLHRTPG